MQLYSPVILSLYESYTYYIMQNLHTHTTFINYVYIRS